MIRVLLAEDQLMFRTAVRRLFRTAVRRLLELEGDIDVVAGAVQVARENGWL